MIRVVLVDDHPVVLTGLAAMVSTDADMVVIATAGTVAEALELPADPAPDVCVLDLHLPDGDGVHLAAGLRRRWPRTRVVILTMTHEPATVLRSLARGVDSYLLKDSPPEDLLHAIRATARGSVVLSAGVSDSVRAAASAMPDTDPLARLNARDREILGLMAQGLSTSQVAARLFLAPKTIRNRTSEILVTLGVATRDEAIRLGAAGGLAPPRGSENTARDVGAGA